LGTYILDVIPAIVTLLIGWLIWSLIVWERGQSRPLGQDCGHDRCR